MPAPLFSALLHHAQHLVLAMLLLRLPLHLAGRAPLPCPPRRGLLAVPAPLPLALLHHAQRVMLARAQLLASSGPGPSMQTLCPMRRAGWC